MSLKVRLSIFCLVALTVQVKAVAVGLEMADEGSKVVAVDSKVGAVDSKEVMGDAKLAKNLKEESKEAMTKMEVMAAVANLIAARKTKTHAEGRLA